MVRGKAVVLNGFFIFAHNKRMRTILHSDLNNFYASVECLRNPEIRNLPVVVVGSKEDRHGIVLAKNMIVKKLGVKTGDVYWEAKQKCGEALVEVQADFSTYINVSREVRKIYEDYGQNRSLWHRRVLVRRQFEFEAIRQRERNSRNHKRAD